MAIVSFTNAANSDEFYLPDFFEFNLDDPNLSVSTFTTATTAEISRVGNAGLTTILATGTDFSFLIDPLSGEPQYPLTGTVEEIVLTVNGQVWMTITGLSVELTDLDHFMFGWERNGFYRPGNGFDLFSLLLAGHDTIFGSDNGDDIIGGRNGGNDLIYGGLGRDFIKADAGNDTIFGGDDDDTYSLTESFWDGGAYRGANVNLATGVTTDSWGGTDTLLGIERVEGSRMADRFTGSGNDEQFMGLRGNDTINGGGGQDIVRYDRDAEWGGFRGVSVNLATGLATDGWGNTDRLSNIEGAFGTAGNDTLIGNAADNIFSSGAGVDDVRGVAGWDIADFWRDDVTTGAVVNLGRSSGQVRNDGYGNVENLTGVEELWGTYRADNFTGNGAANSFYGDQGADTLSGGAGNDTLNGAAGRDRLTGGADADVFIFDSWDGSNPFGDTITDFVSGTDKLAFVTGDFAGMDNTLRFQNGTTAGGSGASWFFFDAGTDRLFWDRDGTGGVAAVVVATLTNVASLAAADFDLI